MNRIICVKGHFYDGDKYEACPHCAAGVEAVKQDPFLVKHSETAEEKPKKDKHGKKGGFFHRKEKTEKEEKSPSVKAPEKTILLQEEENQTGKEAEHHSGQKPHSRQESLQVAENRGQSIAAGQSIRSEKSQSLSAAFAALAQTGEKSDEGKTVGYFSKGKTEPPTGYLICVEGEDYGMGFPLKTGNNSIGRSVSMDVVIMDEKVSREKQAFVMYEPRRREFYMKPGEGTGLCYLNEELVLEPLKMKAFDVILLGDTKLMLVPVCCERFSWDEVEN